MRRATILFGFVFTTVQQGTGAPPIDPCGGTLLDGSRWSGFALHLSPWRKNAYGDRLAGLALCFGRVRGAHV